jgi:membrane protease subunit HflC
MNKLNLYFILGLIGIILLNIFFIVDQRQQALLFQFGEVVKVAKEPGLHLKIPFIQRVHYLDNRILNVTAEEKELIAKDHKRLIVNAFAKYTITDPLKFYQTVRDEAGIRTRLSTILDSSLRQAVADFPLSSLLTSDRTVIMKKVGQMVSNQTKSFGIAIIDVRILHAELPKENRAAIYKRMQTEREKEAREFRAEGAEEAQRIKSKADRDRKEILADAQKQAQILKGEGDAISSKIYSDAFNQDPEFFGFYKSMQAYKSALSKSNTSLVLSSDSDFLKSFSEFSYNK